MADGKTGTFQFRKNGQDYTATYTLLYGSSFPGDVPEKVDIPSDYEIQLVGVTFRMIEPLPKARG